MACDYYYAVSAVHGSMPLFRLYSWIKPTISLGFHQKLEDIDIEKCAKEGVDLVRRPTGGRAILHWGEITYCLVYPVEAKEKKAALKKIYRLTHSAIAEALISQGADLSLSGGKMKPLGKHNPLCFASAAGSELEWKGRKVVGSAQRLFENAVLQHGSIVLTSDHLKLPQYLNVSEEERAFLYDKLKLSSSSIPLDDTSELRQSLVKSVSKVFNAESVKIGLLREEEEQIGRHCATFKLEKEEGLQ